jgi:hypothetical protein
MSKPAVHAEYAKVITNNVIKGYLKKLSKEEADSSNPSPG